METLAAPESYFVLKEGTMHGPLSLEALRTGRKEGRFSDQDLVQSGELPLWQPLIHVVTEAPPVGGVIIPEWKAIARLAGLRLRHNLRQRSLGTAVACLVVALLVMAAAQWSFLFWGPWLVLAACAAVMLIIQRREVTGTVILLVALAIPFTRAFLATRLLKNEVVMALATAKTMGETLAANAAPSSGAGDSGAVDGGKPVEDSGEALPEGWKGVTPGAEGTRAPGAAASPAVNPALVSSTAPAPVATAPQVPPSQLPPWERPAKEWEKNPPPSPATPAPSTEPIASTVPAPSVEGGAPAAGPQPDFLQDHRDAFVIVKGAEGSGSGFICRSGDKTYLYSNIHVVAGMDQLVFTRLGNDAVVPGAAEAAGGPDIVRYAMPASAGHPFELMTEVDNNVRIGDAVVVQGNSGGGGVVTSLKGEVRGIGPDRIEVTSAFIPGNSGSPIIHVKTGKVIGIATYLTKRFEEFTPQSEGNAAPSGSNPPKDGAVVVRRFGYRIDSVPRWEPINWQVFRAEAKQMEQVTQLTEDIVGFLGAMRKGAAPQYNTETLRRPAMSWLGSVRTKRVSENDRLSATQRFLGQLRSMVRSDVQIADANLRYTYFRNELKEHQQVREQLYQAFNAESASLTSPLSRPGYR